MKRAGEVIDLTGESSQEDEEPDKKKQKTDEITSDKKKQTQNNSGEARNKVFLDLQTSRGKPGLAAQQFRDEKRKNSNQNQGKKNRGFTANNGFFPSNSRGQFSNDHINAGPMANLMSLEMSGFGVSQFPSPDVFSHPSTSFRQGLCPDPDQFSEVAQRLSLPLNTQSALAGAGRWTILTRDILGQFGSRQQRLVTMEQKILLWKEIYRAIRTEIDCGIFVFGSTFNGFGSDGCDVDMCLFPQGPAIGDKQWLGRVRRILQQNCRHFIRGGIELINAKVPILKFFDREGGLEVDLSVNNPTSIRNTHLLHCYSQADYRVRPLVLAVKLWAKENGINEARFQTLSSYTLTLMVLSYLQVGVRPPVLPCLHQAYPAIFHPRSDIFSLQYTIPDWKSQNTESLGELLAGFFRTYSDSSMFDPSRDVGSVRCGAVLEAADCERFARTNKLAPGQWSARLLMEEPFDRTNAARAVCSDQKWDLVQEVFKNTHQRIKGANIANLGLEDLSARKDKRRSR